MATFDEMKQSAGSIGREHGEASASWLDLDETSAARMIQLDNDGDPVFWDYAPEHTPLAGVYADDYSLQQLSSAVEYPDGDLGDDFDEIANAYEDAFWNGWHDKVIERALDWVKD